MGKSIAIIGAGIAGLAAGCYAQMNGYESHIFELHELPGDSVRLGSAKATRLTAASTISSDPPRASRLTRFGRNWVQCKSGP